VYCEQWQSAKTVPALYATYSHAESTLAGRGNVLIFLNVGVIQSGIVQSTTAREQGRLGVDNDIDNLVGSYRAEKCRSSADKESKQDRGNELLHGDLDRYALGVQND
jgi:hypothetical protein